MAVLKNPEVKDKGLAKPRVSAKDFQTHIAEPRWQQAVVLIILLVLLGLWILSLLNQH